MRLPILILFCTFSIVAFSQEKTEIKEKLYHPEANAMAEIEEAVTTAKVGGKHIILKIGGNWCVWCYRFHDFCEADEEIKTIVEDNFVTVHVNYSKENKNEELMKKYSFPNRFGFPVFVILDSNGNYLHVQNSAYLESGKGYDKTKVLSFFKGWTPAALDESNY